jgi:hypothetical protein
MTYETSAKAKFDVSYSGGTNALQYIQFLIRSLKKSREIKVQDTIGKKVEVIQSQNLRFLTQNQQSPLFTSLHPSFSPLNIHKPLTFLM